MKKNKMLLNKLLLSMTMMIAMALTITPTNVLATSTKGTFIEVATADELKSTIDLASGNTTIKLTANIDLGNTGIEISSDKAITLDLNGKTLSNHPDDFATTHTVTVNGNFTVTDTSAAKDGMIEMSHRGNDNSSAINNAGTGDITVLGGIIKSAYSTIKNLQSGNIIISGGTILGYQAITNGSTGSIRVSGGIVEGALPLYNWSTGSIVVSGGTVSSNYAKSAIVNLMTGKITISGTATITSANTTDGTISIYAVPETAETILDIQGGTVSNTAEPEGYSVYFWSDMVTSENLSGYYTRANDATVGMVYPAPAHTHTPATAWSKDDMNHWHDCTANDGEKLDIASHTFGEWIIDTPATETTKGNKHRDCTVCGQRETAEIPATGVTPERPVVTTGAGSTHQISNGKDLTLTCTGLLEDLKGIYVDGKLVDKSNYTLKSGSTILTLKASYLDTLATGKHTLKFQYKDKEFAETDFTITAKEAPKKDVVIKDTASPMPNGSMNSIMYVSIVVLFGCVASTKMGKRKKESNK